jgi:hypothetical protein
MIQSIKKDKSSEVTVRVCALTEVPPTANGTVVPDAVRVLVAEWLVPFRVDIGDDSFVQRWLPAAGQSLVAEIVLVLVYQQIARVCEDV